jgi:hypothetical protein
MVEALVSAVNVSGAALKAKKSAIEATANSFFMVEFI